MPADPTHHRQLSIFQLLFRLDIQCSASVLIFNNNNINQQQFRADEYIIPAQQKADGRYTPLATFMKFGALLLILSLFSCVSKHSDNKLVQTEVSKAFEPLKFHPTYTDKLEDTILTLDLSYVAFACQCANWIKASEQEKYQKSGGLAERSIFVEPADSTLNLPDTIGYSGDVIRFTGQFYKGKGYPKNYLVTEMKPDRAKVFRYTKFKIISSGYVNFKDS